MKRWHWWLALGFGVAVVLLYIALPRYEYRNYMAGSPLLVRVDHWTGGARLGRWDREGRWQPRTPVASRPPAATEKQTTSSRNDFADLVGEVDQALANGCPSILSQTEKELATCRAKLGAIK